jgi:hypothetical protein
MVVAVFACKTRIIGLKHDPSFAYERIVRSRMAVAGVVSASGSYWIQKNNQKYSQMLSEQFLQERPKYRIQGSSIVRTSLGDEAYKELVTEYGRTQIVAPDAMNTLTAKQPQLKYLVLARVNYNQVSRNKTLEDIYEKNEENESDSSTSETQDKGEVVGHTVHKEAERKMSVTLNIYDLAAGKSVWGGTVVKSRDNTNSYSYLYQSDSSKEYSDNVLVNIAANVIVAAMKDDNNKKRTDPATDDSNYPWPDAPSRDEVLGAIFAGFAENLPDD